MKRLVYFFALLTLISMACSINLTDPPPTPVVIVQPTQPPAPTAIPPTPIPPTVPPPAPATEIPASPTPSVPPRISRKS